LVRPIGNRARLSSWSRTSVVVLEHILLMLSKVCVSGIGAHKAPVLGKDDRSLLRVFQRGVETVIMVHGRASLEASLLFLFFVIVGRIVAALARTGRYGRRGRSGHLILVDLWRGLVESHALLMPV
jgi:hypothetical protein